MNEVITKNSEEAQIISSLVLNGDISKLNESQKVQYYNMFCESLSLNPVTQPFAIIKFQNGKEQLYAKRDATEQLRKINGVSIIELIKEFKNDLYIVTAKAQDKTGRIDASTGVVNIKNLYGDALANKLMTGETKAKRRVTLSICGLGTLDETEIETIPDVKKVPDIIEYHNEAVKEINQDQMNTFQEQYNNLSDEIKNGFKLAKWSEQKIKAKCLWANFDEAKLKTEIEKNLK